MDVEHANGLNTSFLKFLLERMLEEQSSQRNPKTSGDSREARATATDATVVLLRRL